MNKSTGLPETIVLASGNRGKLRELQAMLNDPAVTVVAQTDFAFAEAEETGLTFIENALIKARHACRETGLAAIADDSGLAVDALRGEPGIYSARYAGSNASDADNNAKLLHALRDVPEAQRTARFHCVVVLMRHAADPVPLVCHGSWEGRILFEPRGDNGFGYDPLFWVPEHQCTSAQLLPETKNTVSHRGQAMKRLTDELRSGLV